MKVVLICHFSNPMVRDYLPLDNRKLYTLVRKCLGMNVGTQGYSDIASWVTDFINFMKVRNDVDLTVISAHSGLKRSSVSFDLEGVHYAFVRCDVATFLKRLIKSPAIWHKINPMRPIVRRIVHKTHPDVVALMGAENAYISGTILGLEKQYPCIFKAQTIYNNPQRSKSGVVDAKNAFVEKLIFQAIPYAAVSTSMHYRLYREFQKNSYNFRWKFGISYCDVVSQDVKEFDFVNFANSMIPDKGFADVLEALAIVVKTHPNAKLNIIGTPIEKNRLLYEKIIQENNLYENVVWTPFFSKQSDLFQHLQKSKFAVLPYKLDYIASTTYQAMFYELPVVVYRTEGTPSINKDRECVLIADMNNISQLAEKMLLLLENPEKASLLRKNAKELVDSRNDGARISGELLDIFKAINAHYYYGIPIPNRLIFNPSEQ